MRALLRRVPDGLKATLQALGTRDGEVRDRVLAELARGLGKEVLPLLRAAAVGKDDSLALSAVRTLPVLGTRAAGEVLREVAEAHPDTERAREARACARAFQARGVNIVIPGDEPAAAGPVFQLRETCVTVPDRTGARSVIARFQDSYGCWHIVFVLVDEERGVRDGFMRPMSRQEWEEHLEGAGPGRSRWVTCPPDYARWLVARNRERCENPERFLADWDRLMGSPPEAFEPEIPHRERLRENPEEVEQLAEKAAALWSFPGCSSWRVEVRDLLERVFQEARDNPDEESARSFDSTVAAAVPEVFTAQVRRRWAERLDESARVLAWAKRDELSAVASALALQLHGEGPVEECRFPHTVMLLSVRFELEALRRQNRAAAPAPSRARRR